MAYAGVFALLQTYKMQKCDSDFELMSLSMRQTSASEDSQAVNDNFHAQQNKLDKELLGDPSKAQDKDYLERVELFENDFANALAEVAGEEEYWQAKLDKEQTKNVLLQKNVENFQKMLESNITASHTYGYND